MAYEIKKLNAKQKKAIEYQIENPTATFGEVADYLGVHYRTITNWVNSEVYKDELDRRLKEVWRSATKIAVKTMVDRAARGDRQAAEFILQSAGYQAPQQIELNNNIIRVSIDDEEG